MIMSGIAVSWMAKSMVLLKNNHATDAHAQAMSNVSLSEVGRGAVMSKGKPKCFFFVDK